MASTTNALVLGNGEFEMYDPTTNIQDEADLKNPRAAKVANTTSPKTFYVVYDQQDYGTKNPPATKVAFVPQDPFSGSDAAVITDFDIVSAQGYDLRNPGIILFEHPNYVGNSKQFRASKKNVISNFPPGTSGGVSSVIVTGGKWRLYSGVNMKGAKVAELTTGTHSFVGEDRVKSIERVSL